MIEHGRIDDATDGEAGACSRDDGRWIPRCRRGDAGLLHLAAAGSLAQTPAAGEWTGKAVVPKVRDFAIKEDAQPAGLGCRRSTTLPMSAIAGCSSRHRARGMGIERPGRPSGAGTGYFTSQIRANPRDSFAYAMRAIACWLKPDFKSAMADFDEAVRLSQGDAFARGSRGAAWLAQQDVVRAQADFNEAIRLEPRNPAYLIDRAAAWRARARMTGPSPTATRPFASIPRSVTALVLRGFDPVGTEGIRSRDRTITMRSSAMIRWSSTRISAARPLRVKRVSSTR